MRAPRRPSAPPCGSLSPSLLRLSRIGLTLQDHQPSQSPANGHGAGNPRGGRGVAGQTSDAGRSIRIGDGIDRKSSRSRFHGRARGRARPPLRLGPGPVLRSRSRVPLPAQGAPRPSCAAYPPDPPAAPFGHRRPGGRALPASGREAPEQSRPGGIRRAREPLAGVRHAFRCRPARPVLQN